MFPTPTKTTLKYTQYIYIFIDVLLSLCRLCMNEEEQDQFWKSVQCTVDKDVPRTDRSHPYFAGNDNPNTEIMRYVVTTAKW